MIPIQGDDVEEEEEHDIVSNQNFVRQTYFSILQKKDAFY